MINVNELMLYSVIETPIGIRRVKGLTVLSIDNAVIEVDNGTSHDAKLCNGIPLNEEWLKQSGLRKISEYQPEGPIYRGGNDFIEIDVCYGYGFADIHVSGSFDSERVFIKKVHQLQKLFFEKTGEELNVKL